MSRGVATATATELATKSFNICNLVEFQNIGGGNTYLTDAPVDISYSGNTYLSARGVLGISDIMEEDEIKIENVDISLSGVSTDNVKLFLDYDYIDRRVLIHRTILDDNYGIVGTPILVFDGRLDQPRLTEDFQARTAILSVSASSHWADFTSGNGRHTNDTEKQTLFTGDNFFANATETQKDVKWGRS